MLLSSSTSITSLLDCLKFRQALFSVKPGGFWPHFFLILYKEKELGKYPSSHSSWFGNNLYHLDRSIYHQTVTKEKPSHYKEVESVWVKKGTKTKLFSFNFYYFVHMKQCLRHQDTCPSNFLDFFLCSSAKKLSLHNHRLFREKTFTKNLIVTLKVRTTTIILLCRQIYQNIDKTSLFQALGQWGQSKSRRVMSRVW